MLGKARELPTLQISRGSGYNRTAAKPVLIEVQREHGQQAVDRLIRGLDPQARFDFVAGTVFNIQYYIYSATLPRRRAVRRQGTTTTSEVMICLEV